MQTSEEVACPLCRRAAASNLLHAHIAMEHVRLRQEIVSLIQAYHRSWSEQAGACWPCWKSYRDAAQALCRLRRAKPVLLSPRQSSHQA